MKTLDNNGNLIWSDRWRLAALQPNELFNIAMCSLLIGFLFILFHLFGNTVENVNSKSAFIWMVARWNDTQSFGADYSHGYLIPFVSLAVLWHKKKELKGAPKKICQIGLYVIIIFMNNDQIKIYSSCISQSIRI